MSEQTYFRSGDKVYEVAEPDQITLRDLVRFPMDARELLGRSITWAETQAAFTEVQELPAKERAAHELADFLLAVQVWVSRRAAGDQVTFGECLDEPFEWVEIAQPQDHKPGKQGARKGQQPKKRPAKRTASVAAESDAATAE